MTLSTVTVGSGPRLVLLHGFTQNADCWGPILDDLARDFTVVAIDAPGHGTSFHDDVDLWEAARLIGEVGGEAHYVGYSMGGRMALHLSAQMPQLVQSLTLIGATPGLDTEEERAERRRSDAVLAKRLVDGGLEAFLDWWLALPLFDGLTDAQACRTERLTNRPEGLASSLVACGTGAQTSLWARLGRQRFPVNVVVGEHDAKFGEIGRRLVLGYGPRSTLATMPGVGHAAHLQDPEGFVRLLRDFIESVQGAQGRSFDGELVE